MINRAGGRNGGTVAIIIAVAATAIPFLVVLGPSAIQGAVNPIPVIAMLVAMIAAGVANRQN